MADEDLDLDVDGGEGQEGGGSKKKLIIIIVAVVVLIALTAVGTIMFLGGDDAPEGEAVEVGEVAEGGTPADAAPVAEPKSVEYWPLEPPFVLNFEGKQAARYMQISMEVMAEQKSVIEAIKTHTPAIRNKIVLLLSSQKYVELSTPEGKEQLRAELIQTIEQELSSKSAPSDIKSVYFTSFVMQ